MAVVAELSRFCKYKDYRRKNHHKTKHDKIVNESTLRNRRRKRPRNNDTSTKNDATDVVSAAEQLSPIACCFQIKTSVLKQNQNGMFATQKIKCGDLIIAHEEPIVFAAQTGTGTCFCYSCAGPVRSLKEHIRLAADVDVNVNVSETTVTNKNVDVDLPCGLLRKEPGPMFGNVYEDDDEFNDSVWCSIRCRDQIRNGGRQQRTFDSISKTASNQLKVCTDLDTFYRAVDHPMAFQMAAKSITIILSTIISKTNKETSNGSVDFNCDMKEFIRQYYWWQDYGSCPLWWNISTSQSQQRKAQTTDFCPLLNNFLLLNIKQQQKQQRFSTKMEKLLMKAVHELCTIDHIGSILGMFQCNAMTFKYASPVQQYMEYVEQKLEEMPDDDDDDEYKESDNDNDNTTIFYAGLNWLADHNMHNSPMNGPVAGSGLYPLLTLANHDCNPNASIEFLKESNRGSMVALRDIEIDEEICLSYVQLNKDDGGEQDDNENDNICNDHSQVTKYFTPTRTEIWLQKQNVQRSDIKSQQHQRSNGNHNNDHEPVMEFHYSTSFDDDDISRCDEKNDQYYASIKAHRAKEILEYGFVCHCKCCQ